MEIRLPLHELTSEDISRIESDLDCKGKLAEALGIDVGSSSGVVLLHLLYSSMRFSAESEFSLDQESVLISILKDLHLTSMGSRLNLKQSFEYFSELILKHSIERPPFSVGIWNQAEMKMITEWVIDEYYKNYKLYQGIYLPRRVLNFSVGTPDEIIELPIQLHPLKEFITEDEHRALIQRSKEEEEKRKRKEQIREIEENFSRCMKSIKPEIRNAIEAYIELRTELKPSHQLPNNGLSGTNTAND